MALVEIAGVEIERRADREDGHRERVTHFVDEHFLLGATEADEDNAGAAGANFVHEGGVFVDRERAIFGRFAASDAEAR